jgi:hypothetical protein
MPHVKVGEFLVENEIISRDELNAALELQRDNPGTVIGQILVTQGVLSKEELVMAMEMFMIATGSNPDVADEWLDQDEIDSLLDKFNPDRK